VNAAALALGSFALLGIQFPIVWASASGWIALLLVSMLKYFL